jgi:hypothetical protein
MLSTPQRETQGVRSAARAGRIKTVIGSSSRTVAKPGPATRAPGGVALFNGPNAYVSQRVNNSRGTTRRRSACSSSAWR